MAAPENTAKELGRRFNEEVWGNRNLEAIDELVADDFIEHNSVAPQPVRGPDGVRASVEAMLTAFPDATVQFEDLVAEGDRVAIRARASGTHEGEFMGIEPTGEGIEVTVMAIQRIEDGKLVEEWQLVDRLEMLEQLGFSPMSS